MAATWEDSCKYLYAPKNADKSSDFAGKKMAWLPVPGDEGFARIEILKQEGDDCQINLVDTNEVRIGQIIYCHARVTVSKIFNIITICLHWDKRPIF